MHARWDLLREFAELFLKEPLPQIGEVERTSQPLALEEWEHLTSARYDKGLGFVFVDVQPIDWIDPEIDPRPQAASADPPFPAEWLRIATDGSGHAYYFVDAETSLDDPPVWHWDEECSEGPPQLALPRLSEFLTWIVISQAEDPLGDSRAEIQALIPARHGAALQAYVAQLELEPWARISDLEISANRDKTLFLSNQGDLQVLTAAAYEPIAKLLEAEEAARLAEEAARLAEKAEQEATRAEALASKGLDGRRLLEDLDALRDRLTRLEAMFVRDFRMQVAANTAHDGQFTKAAGILAKHQAAN